MVQEKKSVLITGASSGIGQSCAKLLGQKGFRVYAGIRGTETEAKPSPMGADFIPVCLDVTQPDQVMATFERVSEEVGDLGLFGLINNAGIAVGGPLELIPMDRFDTQMNVNVLGPVRLIQTFLPLLRKAQGRIINISSFAGQLGLPYLSPYCASKFALEAVSDALRVELKPWNIQVSIVEPGCIATPIWEKSVEKANELTKDLSPEQVKLYAPVLDKIFEEALNSGQSGAPPEAVANIILEALTASQAKSRYVVGMDAQLRIMLSKLPDELRDWILLKKIQL